MPSEASRGSLLFSPTAEEARRPKYSEIAAASSLFDSSKHDNEIGDFIPQASMSASSIESGERRRSGSPPNPAGSLLSNATTGHLPLSSNAYNTMASVSAKVSNFPNASQPALYQIPATRFDTVTSYVDVIYQQQQMMQNQSNNLNSGGSHAIMSATIEETEEDGVVYLDPTDSIDGSLSFMAACPGCAMMVMTELEPVIGKKSRCMAWALSPLLMCWIPFYWERFGRLWKDVKHWCPKCHALIAIYRKMK